MVKILEEGYFKLKQFFSAMKGLDVVKWKRAKIFFLILRNSISKYYFGMTFLDLILIPKDVRGSFYLLKNFWGFTVGNQVFHCKEQRL